MRATLPPRRKASLKWYSTVKHNTLGPILFYLHQRSTEYVSEDQQSGCWRMTVRTVIVRQFSQRCGSTTTGLGYTITNWYLQQVNTSGCPIYQICPHKTSASSLAVGWSGTRMLIRWQKWKTPPSPFYKRLNTCVPGTPCNCGMNFQQISFSKML